MTTDVAESRATVSVVDVDVLIVGAGLSGIGAAYRLQQHCPGKSYLVLEARDVSGGTWDLFRYPGVRSDSDMFTLSYPFRPWRGTQSMADGDSIRHYLLDTSAAAGIDAHIRHQTKVISASWSSEQARWTAAVVVGPDAAPQTYRCSFLYICSGYYRYDHGYLPDFAGLDDFAGRLVHPQAWPDDLDCTDQQVVVIGSGATAVTLVPALARTAARVTMLQRSPSYVTSLPVVDRTADRLRARLPAQLAHAVIRAKNVTIGQGFYQLCRRRPDVAKRILRHAQLRYLDDPDYLDEHFTPRYQPWDQRLCITAHGDLFKAIAAGRAAVVTDSIDRFVPGGIRLANGETLDADLVVSATGLSLLALGGIRLTVDGRPVELADCFAYRGMMLNGVPNLACCLGYPNASWTLRADLVSRYVCRFIKHLDRHDLAFGMPKRPADRTGRPLLTLASSYVQRDVNQFPQQGQRQPWTIRQNYLIDRLMMPRSDLNREMTFVRRRPRAGTPPVPDGSAQAASR